MSSQIVKPMLLKMLILAEDQITSLLLSWLNRWSSAITLLKSKTPNRNQTSLTGRRGKTLYKSTSQIQPKKVRKNNTWQKLPLFAFIATH